MGRFYDISELEAAVFSDEESEKLTEENNIDLEREETLLEEELEELELELKDGQTMICEIIEVFIHEDQEYMVLHPKEDTEGIVYLMRMGAGENDELKLYPIENEEELLSVTKRFREIFENQ